ncbi:hypothetical protein PseudUWO311_21095 [Pseudanabaena sp. UWO311]|uniref:hypothetical protein n=1 Tax=Pseudanabaena sp. UWO311 TaxID=2487337 RepID=UPI00115B11B3|nr:hypothetical protein [Pseudanabaena sp. UWO311]TYQ23924.1 hypothetical protein PseudUWO311_21095 [Pseudanabaena sp. UWO311]
MSIKTVYTIPVILLVIAISVIPVHSSQNVQATPQQVINNGRNMVNMGNWMFPAGIAALIIGVVWMANSAK